MDRLISADALKQYIDDCKVCDNCPDKNMGCYDWCELPSVLTKQWERIIDEQPTIDPVRHGKWIWDEFGARCSDCGLYAYRDKFDKPWESPYCPICGAKMDAERKEE